MKSNKVFQTLPGIQRQMASMCFGVLVYILNNTILKHTATGAFLTFCRCYLNDLVCPLFFLGYCQIVFIWLKKEIQSYAGLLALGMAAGVVWEYIAPLINRKAVSDPMDLLCYFIGIHMYYVFVMK